MGRVGAMSSSLDAGTSQGVRWNGSAWEAITLDSGTYTPALTLVANLSNATAHECQYLRVGSTVTVSGRVNVDPTVGSTSTQLGITIPIASDFGAATDCAGCAASPQAAPQVAAILGDTTNDRAQMQWISNAGDLTDQPMYFTFTYQVI